MKLKLACPFFLLLAIAFAQDSITIGKLTYFGTANGVSTFQMDLDASGVAAESIPFSEAVIYVKGTKLSTRAQDPNGITTGPFCGQPSNDPPNPCSMQFNGGITPALAKCADAAGKDNCVSIALQLVSPTGNNFSFALVDGTQFCTYGVSTTFVLAKPGQPAINAQCDLLGFCKGASARIVLHRAPAGCK